MILQSGDSCNGIYADRNFCFRFPKVPCGNSLEKVDENGNEVYTYNVKNQLASRKAETKAEDLEDGTYRYPDGSIRKE
ncbi:MAG: hypothetical protein K2K74_06250 [Lachnospiraceae bacterium]|nr:hypothetical protein [Lachnospiraceae bacterium]